MLCRAVVVAAAAGFAAGCAPPDCDNVDHGSCVEACCKLRFTFAKADAASVAKGVANLLSKGGPDGRYEYWGTVPNQGPLDNVVQGTHKTLKCNITGAPCYTDSLTFGVSQDGAAATVVAFSHSQDFIKGDFAYGDVGQNYKNLVTIAKAIPVVSSSAFSQEILFGCPAPQPAAPKVAAQGCIPCSDCGGCAGCCGSLATERVPPTARATRVNPTERVEGGICCSTCGGCPDCFTGC